MIPASADDNHPFETRFRDKASVLKALLLLVDCTNQEFHPNLGYPRETSRTGKVLVPLQS